MLINNRGQIEAWHGIWPARKNSRRIVCVLEGSAHTGLEGAEYLGTHYSRSDGEIFRLVPASRRHRDRKKRKEEKMIDLVVTRHPGLVEFLRERGLCAPDATVIPHASPEDVRGSTSAASSPHSLSCLCESLTEVPLALPAELRGMELSLEQVRQYAGEPVTYIVIRMK